jgi:hypothetical protein
MTRDELTELLERDIDGDLGRDERVLLFHTLSRHPEARDILAEVSGFARATQDYAAACDAAMPAGDFADRILEAVLTPPAKASASLWGRLPELFGGLARRAGDSLAETAGRLLTTDELDMVVAGRGAGPVGMAGGMDGCGGMDSMDGPGAGQPPAPAAALAAAPAPAPAPAISGELAFGLGDGLVDITGQAVRVVCLMGPDGPLPGGSWMLHLDQGHIVAERADGLTLSDDCQGAIVLADGSVLMFRHIGEIRLGF